MMKKIRCAALLSLALGTSLMAMAEVTKVTANGEGVGHDGALAKAQQNLQASCKSFGGKPVAGSVTVTFEKSFPDGKHYIDATMMCDINK